MSLNVRLLRKVKAQILKEPKQFIMATYFTSKLATYSTEIQRKIPNCGTAACIGGWALSLAEKKPPAEFTLATMDNVDVAEEAKRVLDLGDIAATRLFCVSNWPDKYRDRWYGTKGLDARARIAAERIDAFIKQHQRKKKVKHG